MDLGALSDTVAALHELRNEAESQGQAPITKLCDALIAAYERLEDHPLNQAAYSALHSAPRKTARNVRCDRGRAETPRAREGNQSPVGCARRRTRRRRSRSQRTGGSDAATGKSRRLPDVRPAAAGTGRIGRADRRSRSNRNRGRSQDSGGDVGTERAAARRARRHAGVRDAARIPARGSRCRRTSIAKFSRSSSKKRTSCSRRSTRACTNGSRRLTTNSTSKICCARCIR